MKKKLLLISFFCFLMFSITNAQLRKDLEAVQNKTGSVTKSDSSKAILPLHTDIVLGLYSSNKISSTNLSLISSGPTNKILWPEQFTSEWRVPPIFKNLDSGYRNSFLEFKPEDNFAQVVGKIGILYGFSKVFKEN